MVKISLLRRRRRRNRIPQKKPASRKILSFVVATGTRPGANGAYTSAIFCSKCEKLLGVPTEPAALTVGR